MPGEFALPAGIGDVLTGLFAIPVAIRRSDRASLSGIHSPAGGVVSELTELTKIAEYDSGLSVRTPILLPSTQE